MFIEDDIFKTIIPLQPDDSDQTSMHVTMQAIMQAEESDREIEKVLDFCLEPKSRAEIQDFLGYKNRDYFRKNILNPLIKGGLLKLTIPEKPTSPNQKYYSENR